LHLDGEVEGDFFFSGETDFHAEDRREAMLSRLAARSRPAAPSTRCLGSVQGASEKRSMPIALVSANARGNCVCVCVRERERERGREEWTQQQTDTDTERCK
jgi:hypothetical protein